MKVTLKNFQKKSWTIEIDPTQTVSIMGNTLFAYLLNTFLFIYF